jgi:hypothetical protein
LPSFAGSNLIRFKGHPDFIGISQLLALSPKAPLAYSIQASIILSTLEICKLFVLKLRGFLVRLKDIHEDAV